MESRGGGKAGGGTTELSHIQVEKGDGLDERPFVQGPRKSILVPM